jgi:uncharacterized protein DUF6931
MAIEAESQLSVTELCKLAKIEPVDPNTRPAQLLALLVKGERFPDAVRFLANTLQANTAVRWAYDSVSSLQRADAAENQKAALRATEAWLGAPDEAKRRATKEASDNSGLETPEGVVAMAAFFAGGSVAPETAPEVLPPLHACQQLSAGAVALAVVSDHPEKAFARFQEVIRRGIELGRVDSENQPG